jgi:hypothetical protein
MDTDGRGLQRKRVWDLLVPLWFVFLTACAPATTPTFFRPPSHIEPTPTAISQPTNVPLLPSPLPPDTPTPIPCTNDLTFLQDLTVPDGTVLAAGAVVDKQWLVQNSGTCNWDARYRLKLIGGNAMGAAPEQALYPAIAGSRPALRIVFTAPSEPGTYSSEWQAVDPDGVAFGDSIFIEIVIAP